MRGRPAKGGRWKIEYDTRPGREGQFTRRFVGRARRGRATPAISDAADLGCALKTLATAMEALVKAHGRVIPSQRRAEIADAVGMLGLVTRMIDEVIVARGVPPSDVVSPTTKRRRMRRDSLKSTA